MAAQRCAYKALDSFGVPTREAQRRGAGWLPGLADIGWSNHLGGYEGVHRQLAVPPCGVSTSLGVGTASPKNQPLAETCFALRRQPHPGLASVGAPALSAPRALFYDEALASMRQLCEALLYGFKKSSPRVVMDPS